MANLLDVNLTFRVEKDDVITPTLLKKYNVFCFLHNQVDSNGRPLERGIYWPNLILNDKEEYKLGTIDMDDALHPEIEVEIWIDVKKPIKDPSESKVVKISKAIYGTGKYKSVSIKIEEKQNAAGQLNRIVQPGWPRID